MTVASLSESVVVRRTVDPEAKPMPTREDVMVMPKQFGFSTASSSMQRDRWLAVRRCCVNPRCERSWLRRDQRNEIYNPARRIQQGSAGEATSFTAPGSLGVTFDGIPIADPATGLWQSAAMPQSLTMQDLAVTYGPGQPMDRWYTNVGGQVEFTPVQPTLDHHLSVAATDGPWGQQNIAFVGNTGNLKGWSTVLGGGVGGVTIFAWRLTASATPPKMAR